MESIIVTILTVIRERKNIRVNLLLIERIYNRFY